MKTVTFLINEELLEKLDKYAIEHKMPRSDVIRMAIELFLKGTK